MRNFVKTDEIFPGKCFVSTKFSGKKSLISIFRVNHLTPPLTAKVVVEIFNFFAKTEIFNLNIVLFHMLETSFAF
jgi:hypothetical protein